MGPERVHEDLGVHCAECGKDTWTERVHCGRSHTEVHVWCTQCSVRGTRRETLKYGEGESLAMALLDWQEHYTMANLGE